MKTLFLFTLSVVLSLNLSARENPFAATNAYEEEAARLIELSETDDSTYGEEQFVQDMQEQMSMTKEFPQEENKNKVEEAVNKLMPALKEQPKKEEKKFSEKEVKKLIKKAQAQTEAKTKKLIEEKLETTPKVEPKQVVFVRPRADVEEPEEMMAEEDEMKTTEILPFLKLEYNNDKLVIHTKYKVSKKFSLDKGNKIIIDYKAKLNFYTKRADLESMNFKKVAVGNHKKNGYFRVVLELDKKPRNYKVNYKNNLITVIKSNEM